MDGLNEFIYDQCNKCLESGVNPSDFPHLLEYTLIIAGKTTIIYLNSKWLFESSPNYQDIFLKYAYCYGKDCQYGLSENMAEHIVEAIKALLDWITGV